MSDDWIETYLDITREIRSPKPFRLWSAIGTIGAILERRVFTITDGPDPLYPNLYTVLAGLPASGKSIAISVVRKLLAGVKGITLGPDNPTEASFVDALEASAKMATNGSGSVIHSAMVVLCREFSSLIPKYNDAFLGFLTDIYDNPPIYTAPRRVSKSASIDAPTVNILAAATPAAIGSFPEAAWGEGFTSRVIFIYGTKPKEYRSFFGSGNGIDLDLKPLRKPLEEIFNEYHGPFDWEDDAQNAIRHWYNVDELSPVPSYSRLTNYNGRRAEQTMKLAMISAVSAGHGLTVTESDFIRAKNWLISAEQTMPDVFRAMIQKSDVQLLQDAHHYFYVKYNSVPLKARKPIQETDIISFFENKATSDKIPALFKMLESSGRIRRALFPGQWIINPMDGRIGDI